MFLHALALSPKNSEVLNRFGEFIEETERDVLEADQMYTKALLFSQAKSDEHVRALENRRRTAVVVDQIDSRALKVNHHFIALPAIYVFLTLKIRFEFLPTLNFDLNFLFRFQRL